MRNAVGPRYFAVALCLFLGFVGCASPEKAILLPGTGTPAPAEPSLTQDELWDRSLSEAEKLFVIKNNDLVNYTASTEYRIDIEAGKRVRRYALLEMANERVRVAVYKQTAKSVAQQARNGTAWTEPVVDTLYTDRLAEAINNIR